MSRLEVGDLLIPATPELLEGWTGPLALLGPGGGIDYAVHDSWVEGSMVLGYPGADEPLPLTDFDGVCAVCLDLTHAEVRDRVARVLWGRASHPGPVVVFRWADQQGLQLGWPSGLSKRWTAAYHDDGTEHFPDQGVPALADLDPDDGTLLPDDSRRVNAEALRAVWLEVAS